jgi:hypothetical protein
MKKIKKEKEMALDGDNSAEPVKKLLTSCALLSTQDKEEHRLSGQIRARLHQHG